MDRSILQDFEREDDGCVLNSYPSAWVLNRTGGKFCHQGRGYDYVCQKSEGGAPVRCVQYSRVKFPTW